MPSPPSSSSSSSMAMARALLLAFCVASAFVASPAMAATPTDGCCAKCIGKTSSVPYTYDPVVYSQCTAVKGVCCFNCNSDSASSPTVENADYGSDGVTPQVTAGAWIQLTWSNIARVTYETYKVGQTKTTTVVNGSAEATKEDGVFFICAKSEGSVVVRGWGTDPCTTATVESTIQVVAGSSNGTCATRTPSAPTTTAPPASSGSSSSSSVKTDDDSTVAQCNLQRASVVEVDGKKTCVCAADWSGPPDCGSSPWWKTAATIGGGIAAALSIAVSVKAFLSSRKAKKLEQEAAERNASAVDQETIAIGGGGLAARSSDGAYKPAPTSTAKGESREYAL